MKVQILVEGELDIPPITKIFRYEENDEFIFFDSIKIIQDKIQKNIRININETLAVYAWYIVSSIQNGKKVKEIQELASQILFPHQVLIGVPELLQKITFSVTTKHSFVLIVIEKPIPCESYFLTQEEQLM